MKKSISAFPQLALFLMGLVLVDVTLAQTPPSVVTPAPAPVPIIPQVPLPSSDNNDCVISGQNSSSGSSNSSSDNSNFSDNVLCSDVGSTQIIKETNRTINNHLYDDMITHFAGFNVASNDRGNRLSASSDSSSHLPDDIWAVSSITQISDDRGPQSDTDIYQFVAGVDKSMGDFIFGAALTYAHTEDEQVRIRTTGETVSITPYLGYKITDYLFVSTLLSYTYTHTNSVDNRSDMDSNDFNTETNLNFFKVIDSFIMKGRAGIRYKHTHTMLEKDFNGRDDDYDELTWIGDVEFGYKFANELRVYTGFLYEYYDREASASSSLVHDGIGFMRYGAEYPVYKKLTLGAKIEHDINDEDDDYFTGSINAQLEF